MGLKEKSYNYSFSRNVYHNAFPFQSFILILVIHRIGLLPSAMKLQRLCFYTCVSVHEVHGVPGPGGVCSGGGLLLGGACSWGVVSQHALRQTPQERQLLLRTVRILLECILV